MVMSVVDGIEVTRCFIGCWPHGRGCVAVVTNPINVFSRVGRVAETGTFDCCPECRETHDEWRRGDELIGDCNRSMLVVQWFG
jgi:hypothetical protein